MSDGVEIDVSGLRSLVADLGELPRKAISNKRKALEVSAHKADDFWTKDATGLNRGHAKRFPRSISYDLELGVTGSMSVEIGPALGGQGSLGIIDEPQGSSRRAAKFVEDDFADGLAKATEDLL